MKISLLTELPPRTQTAAALSQHHESVPSLSSLLLTLEPPTWDAPGGTGSSPARDAPDLGAHDTTVFNITWPAMANHVVWFLINTHSSWIPVTCALWHSPAPWSLGTLKWKVSKLGPRAMCPLPSASNLGPGLGPPFHHYGHYYHHCYFYHCTLIIFQAILDVIVSGSQPF